MTEPDYELLARFLQDYEQAADRPAVLRRWSQDHPHVAADLAALIEADELLGQVRVSDVPLQAQPSRRLEQLGDFRIVREVASGGMGVIYEAIQGPFERRVAVKTIQPRLDASRQIAWQARARFLREQAVLARLHHTHIVPIYAAGRAGDTHYFAMPYIDGASLREVIRALRRLPAGTTATGPAEMARHLATSDKGDNQGPDGSGEAQRTEAYYRAVAGCMADVADAIAFAHAQGALHRDLKPANLMIDGTGHVWVLDFGLAGYLPRRPEGDPEAPSSSSDLTVPGATTGTLDYMPPEQLDGCTEEPSDVWGIGTVLYELLTLHRAYERPGAAADGAIARRRAELAAGLAPARSLAPGLSRDLEAVCHRCLVRDPAGRYQSARAVADDLQRYLRGEETHARPYSLAERALRWARRSPARAGLTLMTLVLVLLVTLVAGHVAEVRANNARDARKLARSVERQLRLLQDAVRETASPKGKGPGDDLTVLLRDYRGNPAALRQSLRKTKRSFESDIKWFKRPGEGPAFVNWFVMDRDGHILTDSYPNPVSGDYSHRDYARPLRGQGASGGVYLSHVFRSAQDGKYKFAAAVRLSSGGEVVGLLAATVAIDSRLVALDMREEHPGAAVVAPMDWGPNEPADGDQSDHVALLHAGYDAAGERPLWVTGRPEAPLRLFDDDPGRREASLYVTDDGCFVDFARVGGSPFVVMVRRPYPRPLNWLLRPQCAWWVMGLGAALVGLLAGRRWVARRQPGPPLP